MNTYAGKIAIITGGGSGIGRALGEELASRGSHVVLADVRGDAAQSSAAAIRGSGGAASAATLDVTDLEQVEALVGAVARDHGRLDLIFNNAGIGMVGEASDVGPEVWDRILNVNLRGVIHGVRAAYPLMIDQGFGQIVNTASIAGLVPLPLSIAYNTSKFAVVGLSTTLRAEAADHGVKVNVVCPGFIETPLKDTLDYINVDKALAARELPFKLHPAPACARAILRGVARNRAIIVVTPEAKAMWYLSRLSPSLLILAGRFATRRSRKRGLT